MLATFTCSLLSVHCLSSEIAAGPEAAQQRHAELAASFDAVGAVGGLGTGTLIEDRWVVTAAHVVDYLRMSGRDPITFTLGDVTLEVERVAIHPQWVPLEKQMAEGRGKNGVFAANDIALLRLSEPVIGIEPMKLGAIEEAGAEILLVGIGAYFDNADEGASPREAIRMPRGDKHAGTNRIDRIDEDRGELIISFSDPAHDNATADEASAFVGDSGGPILLEREREWSVVGVIASVDAGDDKLGDYGDITHATSIGAMRRWIDQQIATSDDD